MIDGLDEDIQFYYIKSLIAKNKIAEAAGHYEKVKDLLKEQLNVSPGRKLMELYNQLLIMTHSARSDIRTVRRELYAGRTALKGALFCDYNSFKKSFELELRRRQRSNCFFTICACHCKWQEQRTYKEYIAGFIKGRRSDFTVQ